jgi:poly(A) polymerase
MTNDTLNAEQATEPRSTAPEETARTGEAALPEAPPAAVSVTAEAPAVTDASASPSAEGVLPAPGTGPDIEPRRLDADAVRVVARLRQHGYEAYLVGGCVRDLLIGKEPKDFDIATSATPNQVRDLFRNCRLIGRRFRLAHVYFKGGKILEVSTFRANPTMVEDPQPSEAREGEVHAPATDNIAQADADALAAVEHGEEVPSTPVADLADGDVPPTPAPAARAVAGPAPTPAPAAERDFLITEDNTFGTAWEDARRRDFTINGLFYDPVEGKVIDYVRGLADLAIREIRTIGNPEQRMREDPVRLLRAVRFAAKLQLDIEARTYAAMEGAVEDLPRCSPPRLLEETFRLIRGGHAAPALKLVVALDAMRGLLPPIAEYLSRQDAEGALEYFAFVKEMDAAVRAGKVEFDDSMLLACILLPLALEEPEAEEETDQPPSVAQAVHGLLEELVQKARLPRRISERCKVILIQQRTLAGLRRRRGGLGRVRGHPLFRESLSVFEVWVRATGEHEAMLETWQSGATPQPMAGAPGPKRRRRRRRGGRGGGPEGASGEGGDGGGGGDAPPPSAPSAE